MKWIAARSGWMLVDGTQRVAYLVRVAQRPVALYDGYVLGERREMVRAVRGAAGFDAGMAAIAGALAERAVPLRND